MNILEKTRPISSACITMAEKACSFNVSELTKRARKKIERKKAEKLRKKEKREQHLETSWTNDSNTVADDHLSETSYYFENRLRKVQPYYFTFTTHAKGRWYNSKLIDVFSTEFKFKRDEVKNLIEQGKLTVNEKNVSVDYVIKGNDLIQNVTHRHEVPVTAEAIQILENTDQVLVVDKPSSIPIHPCGRYRHNSLTFILAKEYGFKNLRPIHRLDRLTSGLMIFCKTEGVANDMMNAIKKRQVEKEYVCMVEGEFPDECVECHESLGFLSKKLGLVKVDSAGKSAHTTFERISYNGVHSIVKCKPHTGRTHQIRVHLQYLGFPILNDPMYHSIIWGPDKGKGGVYGKTEQEIIDDVIKHHNEEEWCDSGQAEKTPPVECSLQKNNLNTHTEPDGQPKAKMPKLDLNTSAETTVPVESNNSVGYPEKSKESTNCDEELAKGENETELSSVECRSPGFVDPQCSVCEKKYKDPSGDDLVMYLHAYKYKGPNWEYQTQLPSWAGKNEMTVT